MWLEPTHLEYATRLKIPTCYRHMHTGNFLHCPVVKRESLYINFWDFFFTSLRPFFFLVQCFSVGFFSFLFQIRFFFQVLVCFFDLCSLFSLSRHGTKHASNVTSVAWRWTWKHTKGSTNYHTVRRKYSLHSTTAESINLVLKFRSKCNTLESMRPNPTETVREKEKRKWQSIQIYTYTIWIAYVWI